MNNSTATWIVVGLGAALLLLLLVLGSGQDEEARTLPPGDETTAFHAEAETGGSSGAGVLMVDAGEDRVVGEREAVALSGAVQTSIGGENVTFRWTAEGGLGFFDDPTKPDAIYTTPSVCDCEEVVILTLTARSSRGVQGSDQMILHVRDPLICPTIPDPPCVGVVRDPCPAIPATPCDEPCMEEIAPVGCGRDPVPCPCAGDCEAVWGWSDSWPFDPQPAHPRDRAIPRISRKYPTHIPEQSSLQLAASVSNPACTSVCFIWSASKGRLDGSDTLCPVYHAPESDRAGGERVTITLTIYDGYGGTSYDQIRLTIDNTDYAGP